MVSFSMLKLDRQFFKQLQPEEINVWNSEACKLFLSKTSRYTIEEKLQNIKNQEESDLGTSLASDVEMGNVLLKENQTLKNNLHTLRLENLMWRFPFYWLLWNENNFTFHLLCQLIVTGESTLCYKINSGTHLCSRIHLPTAKQAVVITSQVFILKVDFICSEKNKRDYNNNQK